MVKQFVKVLAQADRIDRAGNRMATIHGRFFVLSENQTPSGRHNPVQTHLTFSRMTIADAVPGLSCSVCLRDDTRLDYFQINGVQRASVDTGRVAGTVVTLTCQGGKSYTVVCRV